MRHFKNTALFIAACLILSSSGFWRIPTAHAAGIAFGSYLDGGSAFGTLTYAFNNVAGNILFVSEQNSGNVVTGATYNGVAMTRAAPDFQNGSGSFLGLFYLANAATGSHNVVVTETGTGSLGSKAVSYSGAATAGQLDGTVATSTVTSATSITGTETVVNANSWQFMYVLNEAAAIAAGTNATVRGAETSGRKMFDSNAGLTAASHTLQATWSGANTASQFILSFKPPAAAAAATNPDFIYLP